MFVIIGEKHGQLFRLLWNNSSLTDQFSEDIRFYLDWKGCSLGIGCWGLSLEKISQDLTSSMVRKSSFGFCGQVWHAKSLCSVASFLNGFIFMGLFVKPAQLRLPLNTQLESREKGVSHQVKVLNNCKTCDWQIKKSQLAHILADMGKAV